MLDNLIKAAVKKKNEFNCGLNVMISLAAFSYKNKTKKSITKKSKTKKKHRNMKKETETNTKTNKQTNKNTIEHQPQIECL